MLANAAHVKNVPGRKTDINDATWLADLLAHGLIRASFVPESETQDMRALLRTRKQLVREKASHIQRLQKTLDANIKLDSVIADIVGKSGRAIIEALIAGESDPAKLAALADARIRSPQHKLRDALSGRIRRHHRFMLNLHLQQINTLDAAITEIDREVDANLAPFRTGVELLTSIPGINTLSAQVILSEIGTDMSQFPTAGHLISWAGLCPRNDESAGKRRSTRLRKGAPWLKTTLVVEVRQPQEGQLHTGAIPPAAGATRRQEGRLRCGCFDPHRCLSHAQGRHPVSGPRPRSLQPPFKAAADKSFAQALGRPWLCR